MEYLALTILIIANIVGFAANFFTSIGTLIMFVGSFLYAWMTDFVVLDFKDILILFLLYIACETVEFFLTFWGAKKFGASNKAAIGAMVGGVIGAIVGSIGLGIGIVVGTFTGIFLGALIVELIIYKDFKRSLKAGAGGVIGRVGSIAVKVIVAVAMVGIIIYNFFKL